MAVAISIARKKLRRSKRGIYNSHCCSLPARLMEAGNGSSMRALTRTAQQQI
jgi:hypothetical protein